jgi:hypothetical protein
MLGLGIPAVGRGTQPELPPVRAITRGPKFHWFSYYDKLQFDPTGRYALAMEVDFEHRTPRADDVIRVGMVDLADGDRWIELGHDISAATERRAGIPPAHNLTERRHIGLDAVQHLVPTRRGAEGHHLVEHEEHSVSVAKLVDKIGCILLCSHESDPSIEVHPLTGIGYIFIRDTGRNEYIGGAFGLRLVGFPSFFKHGFLQKLQIHIIAHVHHMARLSMAEYVAGTAYFQITHSNLKPSS